MNGIAPALAVVAGLLAFGVVFALNSAVHSYLILAYTDSDKVAMNVGFFYMANAMGRLTGTVLSGLQVYEMLRLGDATTTRLSLTTFNFWNTVGAARERGGC